MGQIVVQIYEIQEPEEAEKVLSAGVDRVGSVLVSEEDSLLPHVREVGRTAAMRGAASSLIPLFSTPDSVFRCIDYYEPQTLHFCESLSEKGTVRDIVPGLVALQKEIRRRYPQVRIMRSIPIAETGRAAQVPTLEIASLFEEVSDLFLTDTVILGGHGNEDVQPVDGFVGITGITCDWEMAAELVKVSPIPVIVAGGLSPENVHECIVKTRPYGVDSCTLTNALDKQGRPVRFKKDMERVRLFVEEARRAERQIQKSC